MQQIINDQIKWIESGKIGCLFASALVKVHDKIGWVFQVNADKLEVPKSAFILSIIFPGKSINEVREWALDNGFYIENIDDMCEGLRIKQGTSVSWVQYFGPDSHALTRQSPYPMLSFSVKMSTSSFWRVGYNGILHLAHASVKTLSDKKSETLWNQSVIKTKKILGFSPTIREAAKTTFIK